MDRPAPGVNQTHCFQWSHQSLTPVLVIKETRISKNEINYILDPDGAECSASLGRKGIPLQQVTAHGFHRKV